MAMPAEEYVEIEYRNGLRQAGKIEFLGGKQELIRLGEFDDVDMAMMIHMTSDAGLRPRCLRHIQRLYRQVHPVRRQGGARRRRPARGVNALNAAMIGLMGSMRSARRSATRTRSAIHPIITKGGDLVNIVPADVRLETLRARQAHRSDPRCSQEGRPGATGRRDGGRGRGGDHQSARLPAADHNDAFDAVYQANCEWLVGADRAGRQGHGTASNDIGDLSHLMPTAAALMGGVTGLGHSKNVRIVNPETFYLASAKLHACTAVDLLWDDAGSARGIVDDYRPVYGDKQAYLDAWADLLRA